MIINSLIRIKLILFQVLNELIEKNTLENDDFYK